MRETQFGPSVDCFLMISDELRLRAGSFMRVRLHCAGQLGVNVAWSKSTTGLQGGRTKDETKIQNEVGRYKFENPG